VHLFRGDSADEYVNRFVRIARFDGENVEQQHLALRECVHREVATVGVEPEHARHALGAARAHDRRHDRAQSGGAGGRNEKPSYDAAIA
jgi:hypothetical protein